MKIEEYKLCYIQDNCAYFTTQDLDKQWGDDWNDAPYEHNASEPYTSHTKEWSIIKIYFDFEFYSLNQPKDGHLNSPYSVAMINKGEIAWLQNEKVKIMAGIDIKQFITIIESLNGNIYINRLKMEIMNA